MFAKNLGRNKKKKISLNGRTQRTGTTHDNNKGVEIKLPLKNIPGKRTK